MNEPLSSSAPGEENETPRITVLILFDERDAERRAIQLFGRLWKHIKSGFHLDIRIWQASLLERPQSWDTLLNDLRTTNILILAGDEDSELLRMMERCLAEQWSGDKKQGAVLALVQDDSAGCTSEALQAFSERAGFKWSVTTGCGTDSADLPINQKIHKKGEL